MNSNIPLTGILRNSAMPSAPHNAQNIPKFIDDVNRLKALIWPTKIQLFT
jgi:hypothetical protein